MHLSWEIVFSQTYFVVSYILQTWDYGLQRRAALWSERCYFEHQRGYNLGENLSYFTSTGPAVPPRTVIQRSLSLWASEKRLWRFSRSCGQACHYTQVCCCLTRVFGRNLSVMNTRCAFSAICLPKISGALFAVYFGCMPHAQKAPEPSLCVFRLG